MKYYAALTDFVLCFLAPVVQVNAGHGNRHSIANQTLLVGKHIPLI
jgi:hypothetical protein